VRYITVLTQLSQTLDSTYGAVWGISIEAAMVFTIFRHKSCSPQCIVDNAIIPNGGPVLAG